MFNMNLEQLQQVNAAFKKSISTPEGLAAYHNTMAKVDNQIATQTGPYASNDNWIDRFTNNVVAPVTEFLINKVTPAIGMAAGASMIGGAMAGGEAAGTAGAGSASAAPSGLASMGTSGTAGATAAGAGEATAGGLGSIAADSSIPQVIIHGGMGAGAGLGGLETMGTAGALVGAGALGSQTAGLDSVSQLPNVSSGSGGVNVPESSLPGLVMPTMNQDPAISNSDVTGSPSGTGLNLPGLGSGGLGSVIGGLGQIGGAITDYQKNTADQGYYQGILDKLNGMYNPGTPEANLMQQQMDAKDAAAGRNSQYGTRAINLAGTLNQQRANIMTSPGYVNMAEASRGHYDNSLNSLFGALGSASTSGTNLNGLVNMGTSLYNNSGIGSAVNTGIQNAGSYLSNLFGGG